MAESLSRKCCQSWTGRLSHYRSHRNDEHLLALVEDAVKYVGLHLENDLSHSDHWSTVRLSHKAAVLLYLVDRGIVERGTLRNRRVFEPLPHAESWVANHKPLRSFQKPILEMISALRHDLARRAHSSRKP